MVLTGTHTWLWPRRGWSKIDPDAVAADLRELGIDGVIPHDAFTAAGWLYGPGPKPVDRVKLFRAEGLKVTVGIGRSKGLDDRPADECARAIIEALAVPYTLPVMLDWEGKFDLPDGKAKATAIAEAVLRADPEAHARIVDCPWWAPLFRFKEGKKGYTHPSAPYAEFGRLVRSDRYVQAYGRAEGESLQMLAWSRDATQYPAIARKAAVPAWTIRGAFTTYGRSWTDVAETQLAEPDSILWSYLEMDAECRLGLKVVKALRARGFDGAGALGRFTAEAQVPVTGVPEALGIA